MGKWLLPVTFLACANGSVPSAPSNATTAPPPTTKADRSFFEAHKDRPVKLLGRVSKTPWQHMVRGVPGKQMVYIDFADSEYQVVAHFDREPTCAGDVEIDGVVGELRGPGKVSPGAASNEHVEYDVDVTSWTCR